MAEHLETGEAGEQLACQWLLEHGFSIVHRNWRHGRDELDVVAQEGRFLVVVEVKTRILTPHAEQLLFENVTRAKQRRLVGLSTVYSSVARRRGLQIASIRIDVIGVLLNPAPLTVSKIVHLKGAIGR